MNKEQLLKRCEELGIDTESLTTNKLLQSAIDAKEAGLAAEKEKEEAKAAAEKAAKEKAEAEEAEKESAAQAAKLKAEGEAAAKAKAEKEAAEKAAAEDKEQDQQPESDPAVYTDKRGRKWRFKEKAPKTLNIGGHPMSQEEVLQTEDVISELVYGNNTFLTQID